MKKVVYILLAAASLILVGCTEVEKVDGKQCSADCDGQFAGNPELNCVLWDSSQFIGGTLGCEYNTATDTCDVNVTACTTETPTQSTAVGPREACNGTSLVCEEPYTCVFVTQGDVSLCLLPCGDDASACGADNYCDTDNVIFDHDAICWGVSGVDGTCLPNSSEGGCLGENVECVPNGIGMGYECKQSCSGADVDKEGLDAGCDADQWCLADQSGYADGLEFATDETGENIDCSTDPTLCDEDSKYKCRPVRLNRQSQNLCARPAGRCGKKLSPQAVFTDAALELDTTALSADSFCNYLGRSQYCEGYSETDGVNAVAECSSLGWGYRLTDETDQPFECASSQDCSIRGAECINWTGGSSCGYISSICVAYCESSDGSESYSCPEGLVCAAPEFRIDFVREQGTDGNTLSCTGNGPCGDGFTCTEFSDGEFCVRHRNVCREAPADPCELLACGDHGTCDSTSGEAVCDCEAGYSAGTTGACNACAEGFAPDVSDATLCVATTCGGIDCGSHGTCNTDGEAPLCVCDLGWAGEACDGCGENFVTFNGTCVPDPCQHQDCNDNGACSLNESGGVECTCDAGYLTPESGDDCTQCDTASGYLTSNVDSDRCIVDPCTETSCHGNSTACTLGDDDGLACTCSEGFEPTSACECPTGQTTETLGESSVCLENPCLAETPCSGNGTCESAVELNGATLTLGKTCECTPTFAGDECQHSDAVTCNGHGTTDAEGSCTCEATFAGDATCSTCTANHTLNDSGECIPD